MKLRYRLSIVWVGVVIFCIITPFLIFYARGFKLDMKTLRIEKTGSLVIKTIPTKTNISLSGDLQYESPAIIRFLKPSEYTVRITKDDYQPWEKKLRVSPEMVTWGNSEKTPITLFYTQPILKNATKADYIWTNDLDNNIAYFKDGHIYVLDADNQTLNDLGAFNKKSIDTELLEKWYWSNLYKTFTVFPRLLPILKEIKLSIKKIVSNGDYISYLAEKNLYVSTDGKKFSKIDTDVEDISLDAQSLWYIKDKQIIRYDFDTEKPNIMQDNLPQATKLQIIRAGSSVFYIADQKLYTFANLSEPLYYPVKYFKWDDREQALAIGSDNEILLLRSRNERLATILRSTAQIQNPIYNQTTSNIFFSSENKIKTVELDERDRKNIFSLVDIYPSDRFTISSDGKILYVYSKSEIKIYQIR
jgi:hypothetical protein